MDDIRSWKAYRAGDSLTVVIEHKSHHRDSKLVGIKDLSFNGHDLIATDKAGMTHRLPLACEPITA